MKIRSILLSIVAMVMMLVLTGCHEHKFTLADCETPLACSECGETRGEALGHDYMSATCTAKETCSRCGATRGDFLEHSFEDATCEVAMKCSVCGETKGSPLAHDYEDATCESPKKCKSCGFEDGDPLGHNFSKASCTEDSVCSRCNKTIAASGHDYVDATCDTAKHCKKCNEEVGEPLGHNLENGICSRCGFSAGSLEAIQKICGLKSDVEKDIAVCVVNIDEDHNPYDLTYDYGDEYNAYVDLCDWSLVFDADYYMKTFPMLAVLYHNDKALLLEHFQTVGIHEGRQGCESFNVNAYYYNCDKAVYDAFKKNFEGYYFYYMLNYDKERNVNTTTNNDHNIKKQIKIISTAQQASELVGINKYRADVNSEDVIFDSELAAYANYHAYLNVSENWDAHDWTKNHKDKNQYYLENTLNTGSNWSYGENNITSFPSNLKNYKGKDRTGDYYNSKEHYDCMVSTKYKYVGVSNHYIGINNKTNTFKKNSKYQGAQFDLYVNSLSNVYNK